jgi:acetaldehyde dehydrogenase/alcohol dehydrogenase
MLDSVAINPEVDAMVALAVTAQRVFESWSEERTDALLADIAECIADHAEALASATVRETGMGNVADKTIKNRLVAQMIYPLLAGKPGIGLLRVDEQQRIAEFASPMGVVFGLVPRTHPVATFAFKVLIALKGRNALILSTHRAALGVADRTGRLISEVLERHGAPAGLVQWVQNRTGREITMQFMRHPDVAFILATGGMSIVRAAYSSGTPAIGVGPGNAPTWICADADLDQAAEAVIASKAFDNGVVCASEHNLVVDRAIVKAFTAALVRHGAVVLQPGEIAPFVAAVFDPVEGHVYANLVGKSAEHIADAAGLRRPAPIRLIVVPASPDQVQGPLGREKLAPVTSMFTVGDEDEGMALARQLLANEGMGHTAIIHTHDQRRIDRFTAEMPASRILVNAPGSQGTLGLCTGLTPSLTVGTGTLGGTSTTDSITYTHLLNIKRVAYGSAPEPAPREANVSASNGRQRREMRVGSSNGHLQARWTAGADGLRMRWITREAAARTLAVAAMLAVSALSGLVVRSAQVAQANAQAPVIAAASVLAEPASVLAGRPASALAPRDVCWVSGDVAGDISPIVILREQEKTQACR